MGAAGRSWQQGLLVKDGVCGLRGRNGKNKAKQTTLTLSPEIEKTLTETAIKSGRKPDEVAEEALRIQLRLPVGHAGPRGLELRTRVNASTPAPAELTAAEKEQRRQEALARIQI